MNTLSKVVFLDIDETEGRTTEKELQATYGEDHVTYMKCDVMNGTEFQSILLELFNLFSYIYPLFPTMRLCECMQH